MEMMMRSRRVRQRFVHRRFGASETGAGVVMPRESTAWGAAGLRCYFFALEAAFFADFFFAAGAGFFVTAFFVEGFELSCISRCIL